MEEPPLTLYKKLGKDDKELIKTNMTIFGVEGSKPIDAKGVASMELTIGSKMLATTFLVAEVQANYNVILGHDWLHVNRCVPSFLHQCLIQWVGDSVETIDGETWTAVALAKTFTSPHDRVKYLIGLDLSDYDFLSVSKDSFVPVIAKPIVNRLNHIEF